MFGEIPASDWPTVIVAPLGPRMQTLASKQWEMAMGNRTRTFHA